MQKLQQKRESAMLFEPLLCAGLGSKQKYVLKMLLNGYHISVIHDMSNMTEEECLSDEDKANTEAIPKGVAMSLVKRGLLQPRKVYSTTQPDMDFYEIRIKDDFLEMVRKACT